jgi:hypothetical protein
MHRMMQDKVIRPWETWSEADELQLEALANDYPFLRRLPYRFDERYGPSTRAPWEARLSPERGANRRGSK